MSDFYAGFLGYTSEELAAHFEPFLDAFAPNSAGGLERSLLQNWRNNMTATSGADARSSVLTCKGRIDLAVFFPDMIYIIEFKCNHSADAAIQQIQEKGYADQYQSSGKQIILIGINFSTEQKNLTEWKVIEYISLKN